MIGCKPQLTPSDSATRILMLPPHARPQAAHAAFKVKFQTNMKIAKGIQETRDKLRKEVAALQEQLNKAQVCASGCTPVSARLLACRHEGHTHASPS
jgi:hypothetical protein